MEDQRKPVLPRSREILDFAELWQRPIATRHSRLVRVNELTDKLRDLLIELTLYVHEFN